MNIQRLPVTCPVCRTPVLELDDVDTGELLVVDAEPIPLATVEVFRAGPALAGRRRGAPGRAPVHHEHTCSWTQGRADARLRAAISDAHAPTDPGIEQAGWRAP